jgi:hypothetical protein
MITNKLRICKMIREKRQTDAQIAAHIAVQMDAQIIGVVTKLKDTIYCNRTNAWQELNVQFDKK